VARNDTTQKKKDEAARGSCTAGIAAPITGGEPQVHGQENGEASGKKSPNTLNKKILRKENAKRRPRGRVKKKQREKRGSRQMG